MELGELLFFIFSGIIILFSILTVTSRRILRAATFLLFVLIATAGLYFMLEFQFLAAVQLMLYAGGIVVLIIFSILLTSHIGQKFENPEWKKMLFSALAAVGGMVICIVTVLQYGFPTTPAVSNELNMKIIGSQLMSYTRDGYILPFELISVLLLAAMIAAIVIAKRSKTKGTKAEGTEAQKE